MQTKSAIDWKSVDNFYAYYDKNQDRFRQTTSPKSQGGAHHLETQEGEVVYMNSEGLIRTASVATAYSDTQNNILGSSRDLLNTLNNPALRERAITTHRPTIHHKTEGSDESLPPTTYVTQQSEPYLSTSSLNRTSRLDDEDDHKNLFLTSTTSPDAVNGAVSKSFSVVEPLTSTPTNPTSLNSSKKVAPKRIAPSSTAVTMKEIQEQRETTTFATIAFVDSPSKSEEVKHAEKEFHRQVDILMAEGHCKTPKEEAARRPLIYGLLVAESMGISWPKDRYGKFDYNRLTVDVTQLSNSQEASSSRKAPPLADIVRHFRSVRRRLAAHINPPEPETPGVVLRRRLNEERRAIKRYCESHSRTINAQHLNQSEKRVEDLIFGQNTLMDSGSEPATPEQHQKKLEEDLLLIQDISSYLVRNSTYVPKHKTLNFVPQTTAPERKVWDILKQMTTRRGEKEKFVFTEKEVDGYRRHVLSQVPQQKLKVSQSIRSISEQDLAELQEVVKFDDYEERLIRQQQMYERMRKRAEERKLLLDELRNKK